MISDLKTEPYIAHGMRADVYHKADACSASKLKAMRRSPAHCRYQMDHPPTSEAMALGTLLHSMVLEPETYNDQYHVMPECDRRTTVGKTLWAAAQANAVRKIIVKSEDAELARAMAVSCAAHPAFNTLFGGKGHNELSIFWHDQTHDIDCKLRSDRVVEIPIYGRVCVDLKSTKNASPKAFAADVQRHGYDIQGTYYLDGLALAGLPCREFVVMAVENTPPHGVAVYALDKDTIELGRSRYRKLLETYARCVKSGEWPSYSGKIEELAMPRWANDEEIYSGEAP